MKKEYNPPVAVVFFCGSDILTSSSDPIETEEEMFD